jgi:uncharacterized protein
MKYRQFGKLAWRPSALGFGCMRFPTLGGDSSRIDEAEATRMLRYAIDRGVNYVDTAYPYHSGNSELVVGRALGDGYRDRVQLATKFPSWKAQTPEDFDKYLNEQLGKLQTDRIDFYLLHSLGARSWAKMQELGVLQMAEKALADGRIRHLGFSFHDKYPVFQQIVDGYPSWTFCQIQHNYMDIENQAGTRGLHYAASKGLAVIIMEPLLGGKLVDPPAPVQAIWDGAAKKRSAAEWALQWLWNQPEVSLVLSGMSTMRQVEENLASAGRSRIGLLTSQELALFDRARARYDELCPIPCTQCEYCLPCSSGVAIPHNFAAYNEGKMYGKPAEGRAAYRWIPEKERASACTTCRECEDKCPQKIPISQWMPVVQQVLGEGKDYEACPAP